MTIAPSVTKLRKKQLRQGERRGALAPNLEIWKALGEGKLLSKILMEFYTLVFDDSKLAPFFENSSQQRSREKVYLFMKAIFTGEKCYFGERPRSAHNWMVISNDLFNHRSKLLTKVLVANGLSEKHVADWLAVDEVYRKQIVKSKPIEKKIDGIVIPVEGYETDIIDSSTVCDECEGEINKGDRISYHLRTGKAYCQSCRAIE